MFRSEPQTLKDLAEVMPLFGPAMFKGLKDCGEQLAHATHIFRKTTKRSVSRDYIAHELRTVLDGKSGIHIEDHDETTDFWFHSKYRAPVHRSNEDFKIALPHTLQSSLFHATML